MGMPKIGPITNAMLEGTEGEAPAIIREWCRRLKGPDNVIFFWMGATKHWSWIDINTCLTYEDGEEDSASGGNPVKETSATKVERLFSPLAHEGRVRILQALYESPLSASALSAATGFQGGGLYYHLKELKYAGYITDEEDGYRLTSIGRQLLITAALIAERVVADRGVEGLSTDMRWASKA